MPFYIHCRLCNEDGSYSAVDKDCGKCSATGNDWREDDETSYLERYGVALDELKKEGCLKSKSGFNVYYENTIPSIKEERSRVTYREKELESWEKPDVDIENFKERLKFFTKNFYHDQGLDLEAEQNNLSNMSGTFDRINLGISLSGLSEELIESSKEVLSQLEANEDLNDITDLKSLLDKYPDYLSFLTGQEVISHESFHFFQFMTCKSLNALYKASRKLMTIRVTLFSECIRLGVTFQYGTENIFDGILKLDDDTRKFFFDVIENAKLETLIVKNFFNHKGAKSGLTIFDLTEGSAFAFQKIANKSQDIETFKADGCYLNAWNYYQKVGGHEFVTFLLTSYYSLKYGVLDDGDFMGVLPTPPTLFEMLCEKSSVYESKLLSLESIDDFQNLTGLIISDIYDYIKSNGNQGYSLSDFNDLEFITSETKILHKPYETMFDLIKEEYPDISDESFISSFITNYVFSSKFCNYLAKEIPKLQFKGVLGQESDIKYETFLFKLVDDFDEFLKGENRVYCCKEHSMKIKYGEIVNCNEPSSFNSNFSNSTQTRLDKVVMYPTKD